MKNQNYNRYLEMSVKYKTINLKTFSTFVNSGFGKGFENDILSPV